MKGNYPYRSEAKHFLSHMRLTVEGGGELTVDGRELSSSTPFVPTTTGESVRVVFPDQGPAGRVAGRDVFINGSGNDVRGDVYIEGSCMWTSGPSVNVYNAAPQQRAARTEDAGEACKSHTCSDAVRAVTLSGAATVRISGSTRPTRLEVTGAGTIIVEDGGDIESLIADISGDGGIDLGMRRIARADVAVSGTGSVTRFHITGVLRASVSLGSVSGTAARKAKVFSSVCGIGTIAVPRLTSAADAPARDETAV